MEDISRCIEKQKMTNQFYNEITQMKKQLTKWLERLRKHPRVILSEPRHVHDIEVLIENTLDHLHYIEDKLGEFKLDQPTPYVDTESNQPPVQDGEE